MVKNRVNLIDTRGPYDLSATFSLLAMGGSDPCLRIDNPKRLRLAIDSPAGPTAVTVNHEQTLLRVEIVGEGSDWLSPYLPVLLGVDYDPPRISEPRKLKAIARQFAGMRIPKLPTISLRLVQIILQQLISFRDACSGWRSLVRRYGTPVPGQPDLWFPPTPSVLARLASYQFIECGVLPKHGRTIVESTRLASRLEAAWGAGIERAAVGHTCAILRRIRGIGPWTTGFLRGAGLGDSDAEVLGDYSHAKHVAYFFTGEEEADDREMLRLLEPYRPNRFYVLSLLIKGARRPPRRGPRRKSGREQFRP